MAKQSKITRDEIADKKVLELGKDYAKSLKPAIDANEKWLKSFGPIKEAALEYAKIEKQFKISKDRKEFLQLKQQEEKLRKESANAIKAEQALLAQYNKVKQEEQKIRTQVANAAKAEEKAKQSVIDTDKKQIQLENQIQSKKKRSIKLTEEEKLEIRLLNRGKREAAVISSKLSTEYERQAVKLTRLKREYKDVALTEGEASEKAEKLRREIQRLDTALKDVDGSVGEFQRNVGNYKSALSGAANAARNLAQEMGAVGGAFLVVAVVRDAFNRIREFDKEMQKLAGISGTTRAELSDLEDQIKKVAAASVSSSNDVAKLATVLVQMGKSKEDVIALLEPVNNLALGLDTTAEQAGEFLIQTLNAFGAGAEEAENYADIIAKISSSTALDFQRMYDSFSYLTPVARQLGLTINDVGAIIGVLNDNGIKAERAGRLMGTAFQRLASEGISLEEALNKINEAQQSNASNMQVLGVATDLFMSQSAGLGVILANNREKMLAYSQSFENASGSLEKLTNEQLKSLDAQLKILDSAWEEYLLDVNESTGASNLLRDAVSFLSKNLKTIINTLAYVTGAFLLYKGILLAISLTTRAYTASIVALRIAKIALATGIKSAAVAMGAFNKVAKANPIGLIAGLLATATVAFLAFRDSVDKTSKILKKLNKEFDNTKKAIIDNNLALVNAELSRIDRQIANQKEATETKINLLDEEIEKTISGYKGMYDDIEAIEEQSRKEREREETKAFLESQNRNKDYIAEILKASKEGRTPDFSGITLQPAPLPPKTAEQVAAEETAEELRKIRKKLLNDLNKINKAYQKELSEERRRAAEERAKQLAMDEFELQKFILEQKIKSEDAIAENEEESWEARKTAIDERANYQIQFARLVAEKKLDETKTFSDEELAYFKKNGELSLEQVKQLTDEELLIYKKFQARKKEITGQKEEGQDNLEIEQLKAQAEIQKDLTEKRLNDEIRAENEAFAKKKGIYSKVENAVETHERRVAEIKKKYALQGLNTQVAAIEELLQSEELSTQQRAEYEKQLAEIKRQISDLSLEYFIDNSEKQVLTEEEKAQQILDIAGQLAGALTSLANAIFESRIQEIDAEIAKNEEKYQRWLETENLSEEQRKEIEKQREKDRQELEKKKRKEQRKQAILNKAMAVIDIGINTAVAVMKAYAQLGPIGGNLGAALVIAAGAIQAAAVIARPIPKYVKGTKDHPGGHALVGEERPEVVEEPGKDPYVVNKPTVLDLPKGTRVTPSLEEYERLMRASTLANIDIENRKLNDFQARQAFDDSRMIVEMQLTRKAIENNKSKLVINQTKPPDIDHELFRYKNTNWS